MNEKYKLIFDDNGTQRTLTENHPNLTASDDDKGTAINAVAGIYGYEPVQILLQSDTVVWQAD